jgi:hypothetical protein
MSVDTVPSGRPPENFEEEVVESFLWCKITTKTNNKNDRGPDLCHAAVLHQLYKSFSQDELQIINNRNNRIQLRTIRNGHRRLITKNTLTHTHSLARVDDPRGILLSIALELPFRYQQSRTKEECSKHYKKIMYTSKDITSWKMNGIQSTWVFSYFWTLPNISKTMRARKF